MRRLFALGTSLLALLAARPALAINNNQSAEFVRTLHRNASTDPDASFYNPAGLAFLPDGLHVSASNQFIFIKKTVEDRSELLARLHPEAYVGDTQALIYPSVHLAYHFREDWALYFNFLPIGGGGGGTYKDGIPSFDAPIIGAIDSAVQTFGANLTGYDRDLYFEGSAYNLSWTVGLAYRVQRAFSVSLGYRLTYAIQQYRGHIKGISVQADNQGIADIVNQQIQSTVGDNEFELETSGIGRTLIAGIHVQPWKEFNIGFRFEQSGPLELQNKTTVTGPSADIKALFDSTSFGDGKRVKITEPFLYGVGISYLLFDKLKLEASMTFTLDSEVDLGGEEGGRRDSAYFGGAAEYAVLPSLKVSAGYGLDTGNRKPEGRNDIDFGTPTHYLGGGATYSIVPSLDVTAGFIYGWKPVEEQDISAAPGGGIQALSETTIDAGIGLTYRLLQ